MDETAKVVTTALETANVYKLGFADACKVSEKVIKRAKRGSFVKGYLLSLGITTASVMYLIHKAEKERREDLQAKQEGDEPL